LNRALQRLLEKWIADDPLIADFSRHLLMITEHTWGLDEKMHLDFNDNTPDLSKGWHFDLYKMGNKLSHLV
jgi:hypothetical protein